MKDQPPPHASTKDPPAGRLIKRDAGTTSDPRIWDATTARVAQAVKGRGGQAVIPFLAIVLIALTAIASKTEGGHHTDGHHALIAPGQADPAQLEFIRTALDRYRDIDVAVAEGFAQEHEDWPETGAHFVAPDEVWESTPLLDLTRPEFLLYSKRLIGDWQLVAVAYVVDQAVSSEVPTELTGAEYHEHRWTCIVDDEELEEEDFGIISRDECRGRGGVWSPGAVWMTHVWFVPNPSGVFAEENPTLG